MGSLARFRNPTGVVTDVSGNLFIADTGNHTIRKVSPAGVVSTFAGLGGVPGSSNGTGTAARFNSPKGLTIDGAGNLYVADTGNHVIRKVTSVGVVTNVAGGTGLPGSFDGIGAAARFKSPAAVAATSTGVLYVADTGNYTLRKLVVSSGQVTTIAGSAGIPGTADGTGATARLGTILGLGVDSAGNIYAPDYYYSTIRKVAPTGVVTTFAGAPGVRGAINGAGTSARFSSPYGVTVDAANNIYVSDYANCLLRKITVTGIVTSPVGTSGLCKFVPGEAPAGLNMPTGLIKVGATVYLTVGNGVARVSNMP
ncbi:hypothetical protein DK847_19335 [Aestuariivirga litoralis]|uniref:SMP-30/Gluconolactonase/LRE-like region domain-containing protein n=1 Tax=Aestuariivirga litoralis TaxID=2650924 RepID=A0A2W2AJ11_9HYPH|nr:hypothetical protein DK847_19335 [Aestuariivirga litoralis]